MHIRFIFTDDLFRCHFHQNEDSYIICPPVGRDIGLLKFQLVQKCTDALNIQFLPVVIENYVCEELSLRTLTFVRRFLHSLNASFISDNRETLRIV